jgi:hypothetical protein
MITLTDVMKLAKIMDAKIRIWNCSKMEYAHEEHGTESFIMRNENPDELTDYLIPNDFTTRPIDGEIHVCLSNNEFCEENKIRRYTPTNDVEVFSYMIKEYNKDPLKKVLVMCIGSDYLE